MRANKNTPDGIEIIAREPAISEHPHPRFKGKMVPFNGVSKVLLADGTEMHECDRCGAIFKTVRQVTSHTSGKHSVTTKRSTNVEIIKTVLRTMVQQRTKARAEDRRSYLQETADELNRRGVKPYRGGTWTAGAVQNISQHYGKTYRIRTPRVVSQQTQPVRVAAEAAVIEAPPKKIKLTRSPQPATPTTDEPNERQLFDDILAGLGHLRALTDNIEKNVIALDDKLRESTNKSDVPLDENALNALELLRRAWQQS